MVLVSRPVQYDGVAQIAARVTKQPASQFGWVFTKQDYYRDPQMLPNLEALQKNVDLTQQLGFVHARLDVASHADLSMIEEAAKRLK
jgi:sulfonate transport system substrate-binding protein